MYGTLSWTAILALLVFAVGWNFWVNNEKPTKPDPFEREGGRYVNPPPKLPPDDTRT